MIGVGTLSIDARMFALISSGVRARL